MLYQTHHPLLFQFPPFTSFTTPHPSTTSSFSVFLSSSSLSQAETEMECVQEAALKSSFRKDTAMKLTPQTFLEELSAFNVQNIAPSDDFFVDELLDFSHEEEEEEKQSLLEEQSQQQNHTPQHNTQNQTREIHDPSFNDEHFGSLPTNELSVPAEDAADLEWLSYFVEDSFSEFSIPFPTGTITEAKAPEPKSPFSTPCFKTPVPAKARSKRTRTSVRVWPLKSPSFAESSSTSCSATHSSSSSTSSSVLIFTASVEQCSQPPEKKAKRKASPDGEGRGGGAGQVLARRCSHCGVQKTPQWRTGPLGAKTLCNACGVRYKSGRLLPEYRPACSPTFSSELHSNHHRKVIEMRQKKDVQGEPVPATGSVPPPVFSGF